MATIVFVHAHPDDEASSGGGSAARAAAEGHRVVLVICTNGEHGASPDDLAPGESLIDRRRRETERSVEILGASRLAWLGYADSGMTGWPQNDHAQSFWTTPVDESAARLAAVLREEHADLVVVYDWHGGYGHPDHIQVHRVGHRAADLAGTPRRLESTYNRDEWKRQAEVFRAIDPERAEEWDPDSLGDDGNPFGSTEAEIALAVDVRAYVVQKQAALAAHASQVDDAVQMASMPPEAFAAAFGTEWFIEPGVSGPPRWGWIFDEPAG